MGVFILETIRKYNQSTKFYQATSSEIFGESNQKFQNELSICKPKNPMQYQNYLLI